MPQSTAIGSREEWKLLATLAYAIADYFADDDDLTIPTSAQLDKHFSKLQENAHVPVRHTLLAPAGYFTKAISCWSVGDGPRRIVLFGGSHPDEPWAKLAAQKGGEAFVKDPLVQELAAILGVGFDYIELDRRGLEMNDNWSTQLPARGGKPELIIPTYFDHCFRINDLRTHAEYSKFIGNRFPPAPFVIPVERAIIAYSQFLKNNTWKAIAATTGHGINVGTGTRRMDSLADGSPAAFLLADADARFRMQPETGLVDSPDYVPLRDALIHEGGPVRYKYPVLIHNQGRVHQSIGHLVQRHLGNDVALLMSESNGIHVLPDFREPILKSEAVRERARIAGPLHEYLIRGSKHASELINSGRIHDLEQLGYLFMARSFDPTYMLPFTKRKEIEAKRKADGEPVKTHADELLSRGAMYDMTHGDVYYDCRNIGAATLAAAMAGDFELVANLQQFKTNFVDDTTRSWSMSVNRPAKVAGHVIAQTFLNAAGPAFERTYDENVPQFFDSGNAPGFFM